MKKFKKLSSVWLLLAVILSGFTIMSVSAVSNGITSQQIQRIRENCLSTKAILNQLHASDALLRVNRGQIYESMSIKLMSRFNSRVANNKMKNDKLVSATNKYNLALNDFRSDYITYEEQLSSAINVDCQKQPVSFYDAVASANNNRKKVHGDIVELNKIIDQYYDALIQFEKDYQAKSKGSDN